jgi:hypothetical protein
VANISGIVEKSANKFLTVAGLVAIPNRPHHRSFSLLLRHEFNKSIFEFKFKKLDLTNCFPKTNSMGSNALRILMVMLYHCPFAKVGIFVYDHFCRD